MACPIVDLDLPSGSRGPFRGSGPASLDLCRSGVFGGVAGGFRGRRRRAEGGALRRGAAVLVIGLLVMLLGAALPAGLAAAATDPLREFATKYAPIVVVRDQAEPCGDGEPYRPTPVTTVLGNPEVVLRGPNGEQVAAPTAADLVGKGDGWYLDYPGSPLDPGCTYEQWFRPASAGVQPTLYARLATDPKHPDRVALQYWFFYTFNDWNDKHEGDWFNDWNDKHEGDWEMVQVVLPAATAREALGVTPESVAFAQHEGSQVSPWDGGGLIKVGDRPVVYPRSGLARGLLHAGHLVRQERGGRVRLRQHDRPGVGGAAPDRGDPGR